MPAAKCEAGTGREKERQKKRTKREGRRGSGTRLSHDRAWSCKDTLLWSEHAQYNDLSMESRDQQHHLLSGLSRYLRSEGERAGWKLAYG